MRTEKRISLKPYLESIERHCQKLSREELIDLILGLAREVPSRGRMEFIDRIGELSNRGVRVTWSEDLLPKIQAIKEEIGERIEAIENGEYPEEYLPEDYGRGYAWHDAEPDLISDKQREAVADFFEEASELFLSGRLEEARAAYGALLELVGAREAAPEDAAGSSLEDEDGAEPDEPAESFFTGRDLAGCDFGVDLREARARYARCVYETAPAAERVEAMLVAMDLWNAENPSRYDLDERSGPMLRDVLDARPGELPERERFLPYWRDALALEESSRARLLLLESVDLLEGPSGVQREVRRWGSEQPLAYLYWIGRLEAEGDRQAIVSACREALAALPNGPLRAQAADRLTAAGAPAGRAEPPRGEVRFPGRDEWVLEGRREAFFSVPDEPRLLALLEEARRQGQRDGELAGALDRLLEPGRAGLEGDELKGAGLEVVGPDWPGFGRIHPALPVKALLMAGRLGEAFERGRESRAIGWSYGSTPSGVLFAAVLSFLALDRLDSADAVRTVLQRYVDGSSEEYGWPPEPGKAEEESPSASEEVLRGLAEVTASEGERETWLTWALKLGRIRVDEIVSNKHRKAYRRAAEVLAALAECLQLLGRGEEGRHLVEEYRDIRYPRHSAFRGEVNQVIAGSRLLRSEIRFKRS